MANETIRAAAKSAKVPLWRIAEGIGINDGNFSRKLRTELSAEETEKIIQLIEKLKEK